MSIAIECVIVRPIYLDRYECYQFFCQLHQVMVVRVGLVKLKHREFGIVPRRDPFIAEIAIDLVDAIEAADHQPLEIKLWGDAQIEVEIKSVVVSRERLRGRAARDRLHHRGFNFDVASFIEELPQRPQYPCPLYEHFAHVDIHEQIDIPLPIAKLYVCQAVILLRQGSIAFDRNVIVSTWTLSSPVRVRNR